MKKTKKTVVPKTKAPTFEVFLHVGGRVISAKGTTLFEALKSMKVDNYKNIGVLRFERDGIKRERIVSRQIMTRLFGATSRLQKEIVQKQISTIFG